MVFLNRWYHSQAGARCHLSDWQRDHLILWFGRLAWCWVRKQSTHIFDREAPPSHCCPLGWGRHALQQGEPSGRLTSHHHSTVIYLCGADLARVVTSPSAEGVFTILPCTQGDYFLRFSMQSISGADDSVTDSSSY